MAVFYWVGGYTGSTGTESGYHITGNYWTNWVTGLTSTIGDVFYSPYAWNVRENWRLEHTGQVQVSPNIRVIRDSVPTRLPGGDDSVIIGGVPAYIGTGPASGNSVYIENLAPHNFSLLFGGMSGDGVTSSGLTAWKSGGSNPCVLTVYEKYTKLNKTWSDVASSWATTNGLTGLQIRTGEIGSWGLKYLWGDSRQGLSGDGLGRALALADAPLNLLLGNKNSTRAYCYVNRKESNLSVTGGATIHIKAVNYDAGITLPQINMQDRQGYGDPFPAPFGGGQGGTAVYGTSNIPASNHYLIPKGKWTNIVQGCGNTHLEGNVEIQDTFELGRDTFVESTAVGHVVSDKTANVNRFYLHPSHVYGSGGNQGINIECYEQSAVPEIVTLGWKNQSPFNCLTIGSLSRSSVATVTYLRTLQPPLDAPIIGSAVNPRSAAGMSASEFWRVDWPWSFGNWWTGPIVTVRNVMFTEIDHQGGMMVADEESGDNHYFIVQNGLLQYPGQIIGRTLNSSWKNFSIGFSPSDLGLIPIHPGSSGPYINANILIPFDGMGIKLIK